MEAFINKLKKRCIVKQPAGQRHFLQAILEIVEELSLLFKDDPKEQERIQNAMINLVEQNKLVAPEYSYRAWSNLANTLFDICPLRTSKANEIITKIMIKRVDEMKYHLEFTPQDSPLAVFMIHDYNPNDYNIELTPLGLFTIHKELKEQEGRLTQLKEDISNLVIPNQ